MKYLLFIPLLFSLLFAWPTGTTKTMRIIVNSSRVSETATSFMHQLNLSDSIAKIDSLIDSTKHVAVCLSNGSTLKPKDVVYTPGKKFLIYWDGAKKTTANDTFYLCFGKTLNAVNSTATYSNSSIANYWGMDKFNGNTFYDYLGSRDGAGTSVDTAAAQFGIGAVFNAATDGINSGYANALSSVSEFTISGVFKITSTTGNQYIVMIYKNSTEKIYMYCDASNLYISAGTAHYAYLARSGNITLNTNYSFSFVYNGTSVKFYLNGVEKTLTNSGSPPTSTGVLTTTNMLFGAYTSNTFTGELDEIGIMTVARSGNAILDRYRVLFEPSTFYTVGAITSVPAKKKSTGNNKPSISLNIGL